MWERAGEEEALILGVFGFFGPLGQGDETHVLTLYSPEKRHCAGREHCGDVPAGCSSCVITAESIVALRLSVVERVGRRS
eukprot:COSAG02_NODE_1796_length_10904_cov_23.136603_12_plen_80_part_00